MAASNPAQAGTNVTPVLDLPPVLQNFTWLDCDARADCQLAAKCLAEEMQNDNLSTSKSYVLVEFARACAPTPLTSISPEQILGWNSHVVLTQNITVLNLTDQVNQQCHREFCQTLDWEGDPDLSGPGVMAAYLIQALLASGFFLFYLSLDFVRWMSRRGHSQEKHYVNNLHRILQSAFPHIHRCFAVFWISSIYFSFAISTATLVINAQAVVTAGAGGGGPPFAASFSFLGTAFSWTTIVALFPWSVNGSTSSRGTPAPPGGRGLLTMFYALTTTAVFFSTICCLLAVVDPFPEGSPFETYCLKTLDGYGGFQVFFFCTFPCMIAGWVALAEPPYDYRSGRHSWTTVSWFDVIKSFSAFSSFVVMWGCLAFFVRLRAESSGLSQSVTDGYTTWGFGQIVAVVGWSPMAFEIGAEFGRAIRQWLLPCRGQSSVSHVESAITDVNLDRNCPRNQKGKVKDQRVVTAKKVKTW